MPSWSDTPSIDTISYSCAGPGGRLQRPTSPVCAITTPQTDRDGELDVTLARRVISRVALAMGQPRRGSSPRVRVTLWSSF